MMLLKIAWRNIWRSPARSFVVIGAVAVGVWSVLAMISLSNGFVTGYIDNAIRYQTSHIQLHNPDFPEDQEAQFSLENVDAKVQSITAREGVDAATPRTLVNGMISTSAGARGGMIRGVEPDSEGKTTSLKEKIIKGEYFTDKKNQILVGKPLAKKLNLKLRKKVVLQFQNLEGDIVAGAFRVTGIFDTGNTMLDEMNVFVKRETLNKLLGNPDIAHEIAIYLKNPETLDSEVAAISANNPEALTENYRELSPDIKLYESSMGVSSIIFIGLFMLALIFGIINTMLMAVLERNKEIGMLMAVGLNKGKVFSMIMLETLLLGSVGAPLGLFLGWLTISYFSSSGLDLSSFASGLEQMGMSTIIYPVADVSLYLQMTIAVGVTALLAAIYPALKAIKLRPVEAMRKI
ncbi:MAG: putative ABC transport system permease protein [Saprospiraceae bacterium]|jgi:putative ABC transport system permease protein